MIDLNITHGEGMVEGFKLYIDGIMNNSYITVSKSNSTRYTINNVLPGRDYCIGVSSYSNKLDSIKKTEVTTTTSMY